MEKLIHLTFPRRGSLRPRGRLVSWRRHTRYEDLGVDVLVSWLLLSHGDGLGIYRRELDMDEMTVRTGDGHHHCLSGARSRHRGYRGRARGRLQSLLFIIVRRQLGRTRNVSVSGIRLAGACRATVDIVTVLLKIRTLHLSLPNNEHVNSFTL